MTVQSIVRTTEVVSVSLPPKLYGELERLREKTGQSRSAFIASLIRSFSEDERWERIYEKGERTAKRYGITSEADIDRILHEAP